MSSVAPNAEVSICAISAATIKVLREQARFPEDFLDSLERFKQEIIASTVDQPPKSIPDKIYLTKRKLEAFLENHLAESLRAAVLQFFEVQSALAHTILPYDDFTFFVAKGDHGALPDALIRPGDGSLWLWDDDAQRAAFGRIHVCSCSLGAEWSVTFRRQREYPQRERKGKFFSTFEEIVDLLFSIIFAAPGTDEHGLVVIAGRTGSGKSQIARKLIQKYLGGAANQHEDRRNPHLVTFEDPIEETFRGPDMAGVDCTQREKQKDAGTLTEVINNALRQTPSVLFVGETRHGRDWKRLLEFAGTGHLVITTAHAGSLVEAVGNILKETESRTAATRSIVADRLLAVVHVKNATEAKTEVPFLVPAIWHRTPLGIKALMADGLSSLLPNTPPQLDAHASRARLPGSLGRYWFARELAKAASDSFIGGEVKRKALEWDLEGI